MPKDTWELFIKLMPILPSDIVMAVPSDPKLLGIILLCRVGPPSTTRLWSHLITNGLRPILVMDVST